MSEYVRTSTVVSAGGFPTFVDRGGFRFVSGLSAMDESPVLPASGFAARAEAAHRDQAEAIFDDLEQITAGAGGVAALARLHLYQEDKRCFPILESVRIEREGDQPAPSSGIGVAWLRDSDTVRWEVDGICLNEAGIERWGPRQKMDDMAAGRSASHYSQAVKAGPYYFLAGMIPIDVDTGRVVGGYEDVSPEDRWLAAGRSHTDSRRGPIVAQTVSLIRRIMATVQDLGCSPSDIAFCTMFVERSLDAADAVRVFNHLFGTDAPALQVVTVDEVGHKGTLIEIECTVAIEGVTQRVASAALEDVPAAVCSNDLFYVSDQIGTGSDGRLPADPAPYWDEDALRAALDDGLEPAIAAELGQSWSNLLEVLDAAETSTEELGMLYVQVARPHSVTTVSTLLASVLAKSRIAASFISVSALGHGPAVHIAICAVGGHGEHGGR